MSEKDIKIKEVKLIAEENTKKIARTQEAANTSEAYVINYQKQLIRLEKDYNLRKADLEQRLNRQIENVKFYHNAIDELITRKEELWTELKDAIHLGEAQCEFCGRYFTPQGLPRHQASCSAKPEVKVIEKHEEEIKESKENLEAKKAALQKQLEELEELSKDE